MNLAHHDSLLAQPETIVRIAGLLTALMASVALAGWIFDIELLRAPIPGQVTMKANTALGLLLCGIVLVLAGGTRTPFRRALRVALESAVLLLGGLTLAQYAFGVELGLDEAVVDAPSGALLTTSPGRMAPTTAIGFVFFALATVLDHGGTRLSRILGRSAAALLLLTALGSLLGYAYGAPALYLGIDGVTAMALPTAILFMLAATGAFWLRPREGFTAHVMERSVVGTFVRSLLPIVVAVPLLVGAAVAAGYGVAYEGRFAIALTSLGSVVAAGMVSLVAIVVLRRADQARQLGDRALAQTTNGVVITDHTSSDEPIVFVNKAFTDITGYSSAEAIGRNCRFLNEGTRTSDAERAALRNSLNNGVGGTFELHNRRKDGSYFWNRLSLAPVDDPDGTITHIVGIVDDITARRDQESRLQTALDDAERANSLRETFVRLIGHELRTPLNAALTWIRLMEVDNRPETVSRGMTIVANSIQSQSRLIDDLVDVSRFASVGVRLESETVDARKLITATIDELRPTIDPDLALTVNVTDGDYTARLDPLRVQQIVRNLLSNAHRYTEAGGQITVDLGVDDGCVVLAVKDTGKGLTQDEIEHVFEPFWRGNASVPGLGVGLSIVSALVSAHDGSIEVASEGRGLGSRFVIRLPLDASPCGLAIMRDGDKSADADPTGGVSTG